MEHKGTIRLETERLILRRVSLGDVKPAFKNWVNDERVTRFLTWQPHGDESVTEEVFKSWVGSYEKKDFYLWAIVPKDLGEPIGTISGQHIVEEENRLEIGYCIGYDFWGKGYMPEALKKVIEFLFTEVKPTRIIARHAKENPNSGRVMQKAGMKYVTTLPKAGECNYGKVDLLIYDISRDEYCSR